MAGKPLARDATMDGRRGNRKEEEKTKEKRGLRYAERSSSIRPIREKVVVVPPFRSSVRGPSSLRTDLSTRNGDRSPASDPARAPARALRAAPLLSAPRAASSRGRPDR